MPGVAAEVAQDKSFRAEVRGSPVHAESKVDGAAVVIGDTVIGNNNFGVNAFSHQGRVDNAHKAGCISAGGDIEAGAVSSVESDNNRLGVSGGIVGAEINFYLGIGEVDEISVIEPGSDIGRSTIQAETQVGQGIIQVIYRLIR